MSDAAARAWEQMLRVEAAAERVDVAFQAYLRRQRRRRIIALLIAFVCLTALTFAPLFVAVSNGGEIRRQGRLIRKTVVKPIRAQGRAAAGYPFLQALKYTAGTAYYGAQTIYSNSPGGMIGTILTPRWFIR